MDKAEQLFCGIVLNEKLEHKGSASIDADLGEGIINVFFNHLFPAKSKFPNGLFSSRAIFFTTITKFKSFV